MLILLVLSEAPRLRAAPVPTDYYVNPDDTKGSNSYNGKFPTHQGGNRGPWLTLTYAMDLGGVQEGDTVWLMAGIYWEDHDVSKHGTGQDCNLGHPEDFPIYWKSNVAIKAYGDGEAILSTVDNCNQDILKVLHSAVKVIDFDKEHYGGWGPGAVATQSRIEGIVFRTNASGNPTYGGG